MTNIRMIHGFLFVSLTLLLTTVVLADCGASPSYYTVGGIVYNGAGQVVGTGDSQGNVHLFGSSSGDESYNTPFDDGIPSSSAYSSGIISSGSSGAGMYMTSTSGLSTNGSATKNASVNTTYKNITPIVNATTGLEKNSTLYLNRT